MQMTFRLEESLGFILSKTNSKLKNELFQRFRENDVTPEQWSVLNCLWECDGMTPKEIADKIYKDKPNTNRILEKLELKALVLRRPHPADKRSFQIFLTESGRMLKEELVPIAVGLLNEATKGMEKEKIAQLKALLNAMFDNLG